VRSHSVQTYMHVMHFCLLKQFRLGDDWEKSFWEALLRTVTLFVVAILAKSVIKHSCNLFVVFSMIGLDVQFKWKRTKSYHACIISYIHSCCPLHIGLHDSFATIAVTVDKSHIWKICPVDSIIQQYLTANINEFMYGPISYFTCAITINVQ